MRLAGAYAFFGCESIVTLTLGQNLTFIGGGAFDTDGLWKPTKDGLGYARVLDYIGVRY